MTTPPTKPPTNIVLKVALNIDSKELEQVLAKRVKQTLATHGTVVNSSAARTLAPPVMVNEGSTGTSEVIRFGRHASPMPERAATVTSTPSTPIQEAIIVSTRTFQINTESVSEDVKQNHFGLYRGYVESCNKVSIQIDSTPKDDANNPNNSQYRRLREDEQHNLNAVKLHELFFGNVGDRRSEIRRDSTVFMRFERDWGSFENWQLDFRACGMSAKEGWAICYYEPFKQKYMNCFVEGHTTGVPVGCIPVVVVDTWHHAWFKDFLGEKLTYLNSMLKEVNWDVVEARMAVAETCNLQQLYMIQPSYPTDLASRPGVVVPSSLPIQAITE